MFSVNRKQPSYLLSLIQELKSSVTANEILNRYEIYKEDPLLVPLFSMFCSAKSQTFYSSLALSLLDPVKKEEKIENSEEEYVSLNMIVECKHEDVKGIVVKKKKINLRDQKSLKKLSFEVKSFVAEHKCCTYKEVADTIAEREKGENEKNIRRRVYDAINVLTAVGVLKKRGKKIYFVGKNEEILKKVKKKQNLLKKVAKKYENYLGIINKHQSNPTYRNTVLFPFLLVFPSKNVKFIKAEIKIELSPRSAKISSLKNLMYLKPMQVLHQLNTPFPNSFPGEVKELLNPS